MWKDPIVAEVRAVREAYAKRFDYDLDRIGADLRKKEKARAAESARVKPAKSNQARTAKGKTSKAENLRAIDGKTKPVKRRKAA